MQGRFRCSNEAEPGDFIITQLDTPKSGALRQWTPVISNWFHWPRTTVPITVVISCSSDSCLINTEPLELLRLQPNEPIASESEPFLFWYGCYKGLLVHLMSVAGRSTCSGFKTLLYISYHGKSPVKYIKERNYFLKDGWIPGYFDTTNFTQNFEELTIANFFFFLIFNFFNLKQVNFAWHSSF